MAKNVYNVHLLIQTDQESDALTEQVSEWASNEEAFSGSVLLDISQIRNPHVDLNTLSSTMERFGRRQEDIVNALGKATTVNEQYTAILEKVTRTLASLVKGSETEEEASGARYWRWGTSWGEGVSPEKFVEDETAADEEAKDETAADEEI